MGALQRVVIKSQSGLMLFGYSSSSLALLPLWGQLRAVGGSGDSSTLVQEETGSTGL
jgi:hypothetical protein